MKGRGDEEHIESSSEPPTSLFRMRSVLITRRLERRKERRVSPFQDQKPRKRDTRDMKRTKKNATAGASRDPPMGAKARNLASGVYRPEAGASWNSVDRSFTGGLLVRCLFGHRHTALFQGGQNLSGQNPTSILPIRDPACPHRPYTYLAGAFLRQLTDAKSSAKYGREVGRHSPSSNGDTLSPRRQRPSATFLLRSIPTACQGPGRSFLELL